MDTQEMIQELQGLKNKINEKHLKKYNFDLAERIIYRLDSMPECSKCKTFLEDFKSLIKDLQEDSLTTINKKYIDFLEKVKGHLRTEHNLIPEGYYANLYMAYGIAFGLPIGAVLSQILNQVAYIGSGLPLGLSIGLAIGSSLDDKAKKEGLII